MSDVLEKSVTLPLSIERAFELFTAEISGWWPPDRRHTGDAASALFLEKTGRFFERASDGREVELGKVRTWEFPTRLVLDFYPGTDAEHPTEVEVRFETDPASSSRTRVTVLHRPTAASAELFGSRVSRYVASWDQVLPALAHAAAL